MLEEDLKQWKNVFFFYLEDVEADNSILQQLRLLSVENSNYQFWLACPFS